MKPFTRPVKGQYDNLSYEIVEFDQLCDLFKYAGRAISDRAYLINVVHHGACPVFTSDELAI